jgi:hypothetical protein
LRVDQKMPVFSTWCAYNGLQQWVSSRPECDQDFHRRRIAAVAAIAAISAVATVTAVAPISSRCTVVRTA